MRDGLESGEGGGHGCGDPAGTHFSDCRGDFAGEGGGVKLGGFVDVEGEFARGGVPGKWRFGEAGGDVGGIGQRRVENRLVGHGGCIF